MHCMNCFYGHLNHNHLCFKAVCETIRSLINHCIVNDLYALMYTVSTQSLSQPMESTKTPMYSRNSSKDSLGDSSFDYISKPILGL